MAAQMAPSDGDGLKIINAGLFRMATKSMAMAYKILGYKTHHGLLEDVMDTPWSLIEQAAEATWPLVPDAIARPPYQRADWDAIWGSRYEAVTDLASPFALELIKAYPDAKVVIVQRDFDSWWPSFRSQLRDKVMKEPNSSIQAFISYRFLGIRPVHAMKKVILGFFSATTREEVDIERAREVYDAYFRQIRAAVPPERRIEYKMGSGWEPLCTFLGVDVPVQEFPDANEKEEHAKEAEGRQRAFLINAIKVSTPWVLAAGAVWTAWTYSQRR
ncbi:putative EthD domain-containing protein [Seiridium cardinale]|uniref:EthD domain-containing protein n=1 Tax=Seiridium cardinale TaxID=138064 RepID=A0ABR2Y8H2_9PEZI